MVACFDLGELSRFHPGGKKLIERANGKATVMGLMTHPDAGVQKQALLAVQKIMVQHWEYLAAR
jgi:V-type H+-transporting ATPase subunit H